MACSIRVEAQWDGFGKTVSTSFKHGNSCKCSRQFWNITTEKINNSLRTGGGPPAKAIGTQQHTKKKA
jgi:hypothetical protein